MSRFRSSNTCIYTAEGGIRCKHRSDAFGHTSNIEEGWASDLIPDSGVEGSSTPKSVISIRPNMMCAEKDYKSIVSKSLSGCADECISDNRCRYATFQKQGTICKLYSVPCSNPQISMTSTAMFKQSQPTNQWIPNMRCDFSSIYSKLSLSQNTCAQSCVNDPICVSAIYLPRDSMCAKSNKCIAPVSGLDVNAMLFHKRGGMV